MKTFSSPHNEKPKQEKKYMKNFKGSFINDVHDISKIFIHFFIFIIRRLENKGVCGVIWISFILASMGFQKIFFFGGGFGC